MRKYSSIATASRVLACLGRGAMAVALAIALVPSPAFAETETADKPQPANQTDQTTDSASVASAPVPTEGQEAEPIKNGSVSVSVSPPAEYDIGSVVVELRKSDGQAVYSKTVDTTSGTGSLFDHVTEGSYHPVIVFQQGNESTVIPSDEYKVVSNGVSVTHNKGDPFDVRGGSFIDLRLSLTPAASETEYERKTGSELKETDSEAVAEPVPGPAEATPPAVLSPQAAHEPDYTGTCTIRCLNPGPTNNHYNLFAVSMPDGQVITGHCIDYGQAAPADGSYSFTGRWNGSSYDITVHSESAWKNPGSLAPYPTQRIGNFQWLPSGYHDPGIVMVQKVDAETGEGARNGLTFEGAVFTLTNTGTGDTWSITLNALGRGLLDGVPLGDYTLQETTPPTGYDLDPTVHSFSIGTPNSGNNSFSVTARDEIQKGEISLSKSSIGGPSSLKGIRFDVINNETDERVAVLSLDETGKAATGKVIPYGHYRIVEDPSSIPADLMAAGLSGKPDEVVVSDAFVSGKETYSFAVENYKKINVSVVKLDGDSAYEQGDVSSPSAIDSATVKRVEGAAYTLYRYDGSDWTEVGTAVTGIDGTADFGEGVIDRFGTYRIRETMPADVGSDDGYMWPVESRQPVSSDFVIDESTFDAAAAGAKNDSDGMGYAFGSRNGAPLVEITAINWKYRDIQIDKKDESSGAPVPGTQFEIYRYTGSGIPAEISDQNSRGSHSASTTDPGSAIDTSRWSLVDTKTTEDNGSLIFRGLTFGYYMTVESTPAQGYAYWYESASSTWDRYYFSVDEAEQRQVQVYENMKITLEANVSKSTIARTTAAFESPYDRQWRNVGIETYRYDVGFDNGGTNVRADQYSVKDACEFTSLGLRIESLWTPIVQGDTDGTYNVKYRTNLSNGLSTSSATLSNPRNIMADGTDRIDAATWHDWAVNASCSSRQRLEVSSLGLAEGEYVTEILLEFGSVEPGFAATVPMQYTVHAEKALPFDMDLTVIPNSATSHITRNWSGGDGLYDDSYDSVETRVVGTFGYPGSRGGASNGLLPATGDGSWPGVILAAALMAGAACLFTRKVLGKG